ncbi:MAG: hypothetical protein ACRCTL_21630 [Pseudomonas sp.]
MDANNPFQTPSAELVSAGSVAQGQKLYSLAAIGLATFFGTPLAGAYVLNHNLKALGLLDKLKTTWLLASGCLLAVLLLSFLLPDGTPGSGLTVAQVVVMYMYAKQLHAPALQAHREQQGAFFSNWRAVGVGLLFLVAVLLVLVPLLMLSGLA